MSLKIMFDAFVKKVSLIGDILTIGFGGWIAGLTMSTVNDYLQFIVLLLTIGGILWRMFKPEKNEKK